MKQQPVIGIRARQHKGVYRLEASVDLRDPANSNCSAAVLLRRMNRDVDRAASVLVGLGKRVGRVSFVFETAPHI